MSTTAPNSSAASTRFHQRRCARALVQMQRVGDRTALTRAMAQSPMKLLCPRRTGNAAWVYTSSYGGGLVSGDTLELNIDVQAGAVGVLGTQASTKVYQRGGGFGARQMMNASVAANGLLVVAPDPLVCYADARYDQHQQFVLEPGASLVLVDWFTSGRMAHGERWAFERYMSRNDIWCDGRKIVADALMLDRTLGPIDTPMRVGDYNCFATLWLVGPAVAEGAEAVARSIERQAIKPRGRLIASASRWPWGVVLRLAAVDTEMAANLLNESLQFLRETLGAGPWDRKW